MKAVTIALHGQVDDPKFPNWIRRHSIKLGIDLISIVSDPNCVSVNVKGESDMVQALAVACSLGPIDVLVSRTIITPLP